MQVYATLGQSFGYISAMVGAVGVSFRFLTTQAENFGLVVKEEELEPFVPPSSSQVPSIEANQLSEGTLAADVESAEPSADGVSPARSESELPAVFQLEEAEPTQPRRCCDGN